MEKKIQDYLHLYLGQTVVRHYDGHPVKSVLTAENLSGFISGWEPRWHKLELRPLSSMTEEEMKELQTLWFHPSEDIYLQTVDEFKFYPHDPKRSSKHGKGIGFSTFKNGKHVQSGTLSFIRLNPEQTRYLLSRGFDLFGLIDAGLAIDKTLHPSTIS